MRHLSGVAGQAVFDIIISSMPTHEPVFADPDLVVGKAPRETRNTGVKGVLADHRAAGAATRQANAAAVAQETDRLERAALNTLSWDQEEQQRAAEAELAAPKRRSGSSRCSSSSRLVSGDKDESDDEDYLMAREAHRAQRLAEIRGAEGPLTSNYPL